MLVTVNPPSQLRRATSFSKEAAIADSAVLTLNNHTWSFHPPAYNYRLLLRGTVAERLMIVV